MHLTGHIILKTKLIPFMGRYRLIYRMIPLSLRRDLTGLMILSLWCFINVNECIENQDAHVYVVFVHALYVYASIIKLINYDIFYKII